MRFYVVAIQHNKEKDAENRTVPKAFDDEKAALAEYYRQLGADLNNKTLDWGILWILNSEGNVRKADKWCDADIAKLIVTE
jgi:hypothetical protein